MVGHFNGSQGVFEVSSGDITAGYHHGSGMYGLLAKRKFRGSDALGGYAIRYASGYESPWIVGYNAGSGYDNQITFGSMTTADRNLATGVTKRMVIDMESGNVGINQATPTRAKLHVVGGTANPDIVAKFKGSSGNDARTKIGLAAAYSDTANDTEGHAYVGALRNGSGNTTSLFFEVSQGSSLKETARVHNGGIQATSFRFTNNQSTDTVLPLSLIHI